MSREIKNYIRYFFRSNRRLMILEFILLFVLLPFVAYNQISWSAGQDMETQRQMILVTTAITSILAALVLAFVTPLYIYRFVFKRQSCDLYYSLPICRSRLFSLQFILGALLAMIPLCFNYLLDFILLGFSISTNLWSVFIFYLVLFLMFLSLYSIISLLVVKCNNLMDAFLVSGAYMVLPLLVFLSLMGFLSTQIAHLFVGSAGGTMEFINPELIMGVLSLPVTMFYDGVLIATESPFSTEWIGIALFIYWIIVGCLCFYLGQKTFVKRKEEDAQQRTTALCTYPFIINVFTVCLIMITFSSDSWSQAAFMTLFIIFVLYMVMHMFAKRSLRITWKNVVFFAAIYILTTGFSIMFQSTGGFGLLNEVPQTDKVKDINLIIRVNPDNTIAETVEGNTASSSTEKVYEIKSQKDINSLINMQKELIDKEGSYMPDGYVHKWLGEFDITYHFKNDTRISRTYNLENPASVKVLEKAMRTFQIIK